MQQCYKLTRLPSLRPVNKISILAVCNYGSIYEPEYLDLLKPDIPEYEQVNVQMKGYDFAVLESFQKFIHMTAENLNIEISNG